MHPGCRFLQAAKYLIADQMGLSIGFKYPSLLNARGHHCPHKPSQNQSLQICAPQFATQSKSGNRLMELVRASKCWALQPVLSAAPMLPASLSQQAG
jgi:hypothetical protein